MARSATYFPVEIPFFTGIDNKGFTRLSPQARLLYLSIWATLWCDGKTDICLISECQEAAKRMSISSRYVDKWLTEICQLSLIQRVENGVKVLGILEKRASFYNRKSGKKAGPKAEQRNGTEQNKEKKNSVFSLSDSSPQHHNGNGHCDTPKARAEAERMLAEMQRGGQ